MTQESSTLAILPNFIIVGAYKGATTALAKRLAEHPDVFFSLTKETHYFAKNELYEKGTSWYSQFFAAHDGQKAIGEASPTYTRSNRYPYVAERIASDLGQIKLIYIIRNPISRMESQWLEGRRGGWGLPPFNEAVLSEETDIFETSCYWNELEQYRKYFPDENILILFTEEFHNDPESVLKECYRFLSIDETFSNPEMLAVVRPSEGARMDRDWVSRFLRKGFGKAILNAVPKPLLKLLKPLGRKKISDRPEWDSDVLEQVVSRLQSDTKRILEYANKSEHYWKLEK